MKLPFLNRLGGHVRSIARQHDLDALYNQLAALPEIREITGPGVNLGPLRHWALSPDALLEILRDISARTGPRVIEFGAGESTLAIAATLRRMGGGSLLTVEHNPGFAAAVQRRVERRGLADRARIVIPPVRNYPPWHGLPAFRSYDLGGLGEQFEVALVDGPIVAEFGNATRAVPLIWCLERLQDGASIYLDDANRPSERAIAKALRLDWTALEIEQLPTEKGLLRLNLQPPPSAPAGY